MVYVVEVYDSHVMLLLLCVLCALVVLVLLARVSVAVVNSVDAGGGAERTMATILRVWIPQ